MGKDLKNQAAEVGRGFYELEEKPEFQEQVEKLLNSDSVRAEGSFFERLILRMLNNIKAAYQRAESLAGAIGRPGGSASLNESGQIPADELPLGLPGGAAELDKNSKVPVVQLPAGTPDGLATLDGEGKIPTAQIPALEYDPKGAAATEAAKTQTNLNNHAADTTKHITAAERTAWNAKADASALTSHIGNQANPHGITAAQVGALPLAGGTIAGNLTLKNSTNYGCKLNFGDGDYVHISEPTDDCLEIKAKNVTFSTTNPIHGVPTPSAGTDAANKDYVDNKNAKAGSFYLSTLEISLVESLVEAGKIFKIKRKPVISSGLKDGTYQITSLYYSEGDEPLIVYAWPMRFSISGGDTTTELSVYIYNPSSSNIRMSRMSAAIKGCIVAYEGW